MIVQCQMRCQNGGLLLLIICNVEEVEEEKCRRRKKLRKTMAIQLKTTCLLSFLIFLGGQIDMKGETKKKENLVLRPPQYNIEVHSGSVVFSCKPTSLNSHKKREEIKRKKKYNLWGWRGGYCTCSFNLFEPFCFRLGLLVYFSWMDHQSRMQLASILEKASLWIGLSEIFY